jgi:hypothetical protein
VVKFNRDFERNFAWRKDAYPVESVGKSESFRPGLEVAVTVDSASWYCDRCARGTSTNFVGFSKKPKKSLKVQPDSFFLQGRCA